MNPYPYTRRWEIDCLRGVAVGLMVVSNFLFDLVFFAGQDQLQSGALDWFARFIAGFFIVVAGISLTLAHDRAKRQGFGFGRNLCRGLKLLGLGVVISGVTWFAVGEQMVWFGVLHLIGAGVILAYPFLGRPRLSLVAGLLILASNVFVRQLRLDRPWFLWLGLQPQDYASVDYAPLIPWFGVMLIGVSLGHRLYPGGVPRWPLADRSISGHGVHPHREALPQNRKRLQGAPDARKRPANYTPVCEQAADKADGASCDRLHRSQSRLCRALAWCGRRSLMIYFGHQPLLLAGIVLTRKWW